MQLNPKKIIKLTSFAFISLIVLAFFAVIILWLFIVPNIIKSDKFAKTVNEYLHNYVNLDLTIDSPDLKTALNPEITFKVKNLVLRNDNETLIDLKDFDSSINFKNIFKKEIKLNKLRAKNIVVKADKLQEIKFKEQKQEQQENDFKIDFYKADIGVDNLDISYNQKNNSNVEILAKDVTITQENNYKLLGFNLEAFLNYKNKQYADVIATTIDEIKLYDDKLTINDFRVVVNNSKLTLNSTADLKNIKINAKSDKFLLKDIFDVVNANFIVPNGSELLKPLKNPSGSVGFNVNYINGDLSGNLTVNNTKAELKDLTSIPLNIQKGLIKITKDKIEFKDLTGWYGKDKEKNTLKIYGDIKDYYKTFDSNIIVDTFATNEFFKNYLAPLINNTILHVSSPARARITYKAKNGIMDIDVNAGVRKGVEFSIANQKPLITDYNRGFKGDFHIENDVLEIRNINYYIVPELNKNVKPQPVLVLDGKMKLNGKIDNLGFKFDREIPCEFLNIFAGAGFFKKGTIIGNMHIFYKNNIPMLVSDMKINKTFIPSQRLYIRNATLKSETNKDIYVNADGKFKRSEYKMDGFIQNKLLAPYVVKKLTLDMDDIDVERFLTAVNNQGQENTKEVQATTEDIGNDDYMFDLSILRIDDIDFNLKKGHYKELEFGNINAKLTLDDKSILKIKSNRFDFAKGISTLKVECDLKNLKYSVRLGVRKVDSNLIAKVLLNLDKEISGLASGLIELNSDKDLKLNGSIKFLVDDGTIGKIGLVEYVLKIASVFRNPIVMISPGTIMDIISVPEGKFDKITGEMDIKDNIIRKINIKSYSSTLSALIKGRIDLEKHDMSLRIYTRFSSSKKSVFNFLRNFSLNALANKVQLNSRNDANYYSSELSELPSIDVEDDRTQVFLTNVEGDVEHNNFLSSLKKIK